MSILKLNKADGDEVLKDQEKVSKIDTKKKKIVLSSVVYVVVDILILLNKSTS